MTTHNVQGLRVREIEHRPIVRTANNFLKEDQTWQTK
jgi:hypothetical protein